MNYFSFLPSTYATVAIQHGYRIQIVELLKTTNQILRPFFGLRLQLRSFITTVILIRHNEEKNDIEISLIRILGPILFFLMIIFSKLEIGRAYDLCHAVRTRNGTKLYFDSSHHWNSSVMYLEVLLLIENPKTTRIAILLHCCFWFNKQRIF